jgi:hypothetical protein
MTATRRARIAWFADLEALDADRSVLEVLRDEAGLTTVVPESHISHTSGFRASAGVAAASPVADWASRPGLADHRAVFGVAEPAMAVLPGVVGGVDDAPLLRVTEECRRLGLEVWGHAGVWCYGAEVFPELAAVDLFGRPMLPASLPWGTMFCPSRPELHAWMADSLADAAGRYDLDGWFLDHARHPSPGFAPGLLACGCDRCAAAAAGHGVDLDGCRRDIRALAAALAGLTPRAVTALSEAGPAGLAGWLARFPGVLRWLDVRAAILADRFADLGAAIGAASPRAVEFGSDVFPGSVALLGGQDLGRWSRAATFLTGGFGPRIGWGSVGRVTAEGLGDALATIVPGLEPAAARRAVAALVGAPLDPDPSLDERTARLEYARMAAVRGTLPVYPPIPGPPPPDALERMCDAIVDAGLDGAMVAGLEASTAAQRRVLRVALSERLA